VRVFLDSSVLLAAAGSTKGASRFVILNHPGCIELVTSDYCIHEVEFNLNKLNPQGAVDWHAQIKPELEIIPVRISLSKILIYPKAKDRPVIITALSTNAGCLLTLDKTDFKGLLGESIYQMWILSPAQFLNSKLV
jgi:predicted nucleic acid-binding protein